MLNVGRIEEGFVLDHIKAGKAMTIYHDLKLDKLDCCVAIIKNARSNKMGKKDIIKVECSVDLLDLQTGADASQTDHQCDQVQKSPLHHLRGAGAGSRLYPDRPG